MDAHVDEAFGFSTGKSRRARRDSAFCCGTLVVLAGVLGLLPDTCLAGAFGSRIALQALFGLLLAGLVAMRFHWWARYSPPARTIDIRRFSRQSSRMIYLILYLVIGAKQILAAVGDVPAVSAPARGLASLETGPDFFLMYGIIALVWVRVLAYGSWRRLTRGGGAISSSQ